MTMYNIKPGNALTLILIVVALLLPSSAFLETKEAKKVGAEGKEAGSGDASTKENQPATNEDPSPGTKVMPAPLNPIADGSVPGNIPLPNPGPQAQASLEFTEPEPFTPERYFRILLQRQRLSISSFNQVLIILDAHNGDPLSAMKDLKRHEMERQAKMERLINKHGLNPEDYYRSCRGAEEQKERADYLDEHPEIRDELAANSNQLRALEKEAWELIRPLWSQHKP